MTDRPKALTLADVVAALAGGAGVPAGIPPVEIRDIAVDSRQVRPGGLFVALRGEHGDGHDYIPDAVGSGAAVVIAERLPGPGGLQVIDLRTLTAWTPEAGRPVCLIVPDGLAALQQAAAYWRRQHPITVAGITGSIGKTTSKEMAAAVLSERFCTLKSEGNYNNEIGLPLTLLRLSGEHEVAVLEMGMYDLGEIRQLASIALPRVGLVTNVGPSHLERLGTIERIAQAKAELPQALPPAAEGGIVVLNADDERVMAMAGQTQARVLTYGLQPSADIWADDIESEGLDGIRFRFHHSDEVLHARLPFLGRHSVHAALGAAGLGVALGLSWPEIVAGLGNQRAQLRLIAVPGPAGSTLLDDTYNSSPASCIAALNLLAELEGRKVAVLGDMYELGAYSEEGHRLVGQRAREVADVLVTVGPLGRLIGEVAKEAGLTAGTGYQVETNAEAAALLADLIQAGDVVLIKGSRGMKMEEIVEKLATKPAAPERGRL